MILRMGLALTYATVLALAACQSAAPHKPPDSASPGPSGQRLNAATYVAQGHLLERQGHLEQAAEQYRRALVQTPDLVAARNRLGITLTKLGRPAEAAEQFRTALAHAPEAYLYNNLGFSLEQAGRWSDALEALDRALEIQPSFSRAHMNRGVVLGRLGRDTEALAAFVLVGTEVDAYYNLGVVQADGQRYAAAARSFERALQLAPDMTAAWEQLRVVARLAATETIAEPDAPDARAAEFVLAGDAGPPHPEEAAMEHAALPPETDGGESAYGRASAVPGVREPFFTLFDDLVGALVAEAPWCEGALCELQAWLGTR